MSRAKDKVCLSGVDGRRDGNPRGDHCRPDHGCDEGNGTTKTAMAAHMHSLQRSTEKLRFFFEKDALKYEA
jgi:hypothetical protein